MGQQEQFFMGEVWGVKNVQAAMLAKFEKQFAFRFRYTALAWSSKLSVGARRIFSAGL